MHVQGLYETRMSTETFNTVDEFAEVKSQRSGSKTGKAAFSEEKSKLSSATALSVGVTGSGNAGVSKGGAGVQESLQNLLQKTGKFQIINIFWKFEQKYRTYCII
jgi:hypothetical protein